METLCKNILSNWFSPRLSSIRTLKKYPRYRKGLPIYQAKSLDQKLQEANYKDPAIYFKVNIGLPQTIHNRTDILHERIAQYKRLRSDPHLEKKARENKISLCLDDVTKEWIQESSHRHIKDAAEHYGVFQDLFGDAFFYSVVNLDVAFKHMDSLIPVYRGNILKPVQAQSAPLVTYDADPSSLWTLVVTNPDGQLHEENAEYLHWLLGNIPGSDLSQGEMIADYVQPFPARGTGFQRFVFVLYKQNEKINYSSLKKPKVVDLESRTFRTIDFYRNHQDQLTPAGIAFSQVDWDPSVSQFFHTVLGLEEPVYQYDFDAPYYKKQRKYPIKQPFNLYMDRYRDPKQIAKEYLLKKLQERHPFEAPKSPLQYPNAVPVSHDLNKQLFGRIPSWLKREKLKQRLGYGRINDY